MKSTDKFRGTARYITTRDLEIAVNASVTLGRPLLVKGEPGTGKRVLAEEVRAASLDLPLLPSTSNRSPNRRGVSASQSGR
jgi:MoxR-like ATPase